MTQDQKTDLLLEKFAVMDGHFEAIGKRFGTLEKRV